MGLLLWSNRWIPSRVCNAARKMKELSPQFADSNSVGGWISPEFMRRPISSGRARHSSKKKKTSLPENSVRSAWTTGFRGQLWWESVKMNQSWLRRKGRCSAFTRDERQLVGPWLTGRACEKKRNAGHESQPRGTAGRLIVRDCSKRTGGERSLRCWLCSLWR